MKSLKRKKKSLSSRGTAAKFCKLSKELRDKVIIIAGLSAYKTHFFCIFRFFFIHTQYFLCTFLLFFVLFFINKSSCINILFRNLIYLLICGVFFLNLKHFFKIFISFNGWAWRLSLKTKPFKLSGQTVPKSQILYNLIVLFVHIFHFSTLWSIFALLTTLLLEILTL